MANRDDPWARFRRLVTTWLRTPSTWRGLLLAVLLGGAFTWGVIVLGIALTMAESGAEQWWLVLVFGGAVLAMMLASGYLLFNRGNRGAGPDAAGSGRAADTPPMGTIPAQASTPPPPPAGGGGGLEPLSERELEVLQLLATGRSNREIAAELYVATGTVKAHLNHIFRKLEARSRLQAVTPGSRAAAPGRARPEINHLTQQDQPDGRCRATGGRPSVGACSSTSSAGSWRR